MHGWVILPDIHFGGDHDARAYACAMEAVAYLRPTAVCQLGDLMDVVSLSRHSARLTREHIAKFDSLERTDIIPAQNFWRDINRVSSVRRTVYVLGNHEARFDTAAAEDPRVASLIDSLHPVKVFSPLVTELVSYDNVCGLKPHNVAKLEPNLWATHGWSHAKQAARAHLQSCTDFSLVYGHTHRIDQARKPCPSTGETIRAWSPGCLGNKTPNYRGTKPAQIDHGFSVVYVSRHNPRDWTAYTVEIEHGRCILPDGKEIKA
jgi:hypothetical protein